MEDSNIIELYFNRDDSAVTRTDEKYGRYCRTIANNITGNKEDGEECVSDAYLNVWNSIPPTKPVSFKPWLGRVVRNAGINLYNKLHAKKRFAVTAQLDELSECIPSGDDVAAQFEDAEIARVISAWIRSLSHADARLFVRRYWHCEKLETLAKSEMTTANKLAGKLYRLRDSLKKTLEREGICI